MNRRFGVEIEAYGVRKDVLRNALRAAGLEAEYAGYGEAATAYWKVSRDGSLVGDSAFELVSPVLQGPEGISDLSAALTVLNAKNAKVNHTMGLHVHVEVADYDLAAFKRIVKSFANNEDIFDALMPQSRRYQNNRYTRSLIGLTAEMDTAARIAAVKAFFDRVDACATVEAVTAILGDRYHKLNLLSFREHGTVEFRHHSGTVNRHKVANWVAFCIAFVNHAKSARDIRPWGENRMTMKARLRTLLRMVGRDDLYPFYAKRLDELKANATGE